MRKSELSDKQLEDLLRQMPKVKDHRDPRDVYQNIAVKLNKQKRRPVWIGPSIAMAAALLLIFILSPNLINWRDSAELSKSDADLSEQKMEMTQDNNEATSQERSSVEDGSAKTESFEGASGSSLLQNKEMIEQHTAVYTNDLLDQQLVTYEIPDPNFNFIVPVSILVPKQEEMTWLSLYEETASKLTEEEWGLYNYYPLNADFDRIKGEDAIRVDVPADNAYCCKHGSVMERVFITALERMFHTEQIDQVALFTDGIPGIEFSHFGFKTEIEVESVVERAYYFYYPEGQERPFLVPSEEHSSSFAEALSKMAEAPTGLEATLPKELKINIKGLKADNQNKTITIPLADGTELSEEMVPNLEAILLSAKSFGFEYVKFENAKLDQIGPFSLNKSIEVPVSANKRKIQP